MDPNGKGPFDKDVLEDPAERKMQQFGEAPPSQYDRPPLSEKDFIQESKEPYSFPLWLWLAFIIMVVLIVWGTMSWYQGKTESGKNQKPFLEVTNRQLSVFLWQFPSYLRANVSKKIGYLTGFFTDRVEVDNSAADEFAVAPPELLFLYHTWDRLLAPDYIAKPFTAADFDKFLAQEEIWQPAKWKDAPKGYVDMISSKSYEKTEDLETLSKDLLPIIVRQAFQGWRNYYADGEKINQLSPTIDQVVKFIHAHPKYGRNYWRNIGYVYGQPIAGEKYLQLMLTNSKPSDEKFPSDQLASFLKVAMFNAQSH